MTGYFKSDPYRFFTFRSEFNWVNDDFFVVLKVPYSKFLILNEMKNLYGLLF